MFGYAQLPIDWPGVPGRWAILARDGAAMATAPYRHLSDLNSFIHTRVLREESGAVARLFNIRFTADRLAALWEAWPGTPQPCAKLWREDGSHAQPEPDQDIEGKPLPADIQVNPVPYPLLEHDLDTLQAIARQGVTIVIYESPIFPGAKATYESLASETTLEVRRRLLAGCQARGLHCYQAPAEYGSAEMGHWPDISHPPTRVLNRWIADLTDRHLPRAEASR